MMPDRLWFHPIPHWIQDDPQYQYPNSKAGKRLTLIAIAGRCSTTLADGSRRGCFGGRWLADIVGCSESAMKKYIASLIADGFIVKLKRGGGTKPDGAGIANEYGVPATRGALDHLAVDGGRGSKHTSQKLPGIPGEKRPGSGQILTGIPGENCRQSSSSISELINDETHGAPVPKRNGAARSSANGKAAEGINQSDDDDLLRELPDDADVDRIATVLRRHGMSKRPAEKYARNRMMTPALARHAIRLTVQNADQNPGGYLRRMLDELLTQASDDAQAAQNEHAEQQRNQIEKVKANIGAWISAGDDAALSAAYERIGMPAMTAGELRNHPTQISLLANELHRAEQREQTSGHLTLAEAIG